MIFKPLWSISESDHADGDQKKAQTQQIKAQTAQIYIDIGALDPKEVRRGLAQEGEFQIEELLDGVDVDGDDLWGGEGCDQTWAR